MIDPYTGQEEENPETMGLGMGPGMSLYPQATPVEPGEDPLASAQATLSEAAGIIATPPAAPPPAPTGAPPPLPTPESTAQQGQTIREQQFAGVDAARSLDQQELAAAQGVQAAKSTQAQAQADADVAKQEAYQTALKEKQQIDAKYGAIEAQRKQESDAAAQAYATAKPKDWFQEAPTGQKFAVLLSMALAHFADALGSNRGQKSNLGQQALTSLTTSIDRKKAQEMGEIERKYKVAEAAADKATRARADAIQGWATKWAGVEKGLELQARSELSKAGVNVAKQEGNVALVTLQKRAADADAKRLEVINDDIARERQLEISAAAQAARARRAGAGGGVKGLTPTQQEAKERREKESEVFNLDGSPAGHAKNPREAEALRTAQSATSGYIDAIGRLKDLVEREGTIIPPWKVSERKERANILQELTGYVSEMRKTGVLQDKEYSRYMGALEPGAFEKNADAIAGLDKLSKAASGFYTRKLQAQGAANTEIGGQIPTRPQELAPERAPKRTVPTGAEEVSYKGVPGYRIPRGTKDGKRVWEFVAWPKE